MDYSVINKKRSECQKLVSLGAVIAILGIVIILINIGIEILGILALFAGMVCAIVGFTKFSALSKEFKNTYLRKMIEKMFNNGKYNPTRGVDINKVYQTNLIKKADRHHTEDLITGDIDNVRFESCDVKLEERHVRKTKNGTQVYYVTYFLGRFFEFEFPKEFKSQILVTEGMIMTFFSKFKKVELESIDFNKKFKTYATNEHDAFYVLTPHFMEALMELERNNPGTVMLSFNNRKLSILLNNNKNTFELNLFKPIDEATIKGLERDLLVIKNIVTELKLNKNIFID